MFSPEDVAAVALQDITSRQSKEAILDATSSKGNARQLPAFHLLDLVWTMRTLQYLLINFQVMLLHCTDPLAERSTQSR